MMRSSCRFKKRSMVILRARYVLSKQHHAGMIMGRHHFGCGLGRAVLPLWISVPLWWSTTRERFTTETPSSTERHRERSDGRFELIRDHRRAFENLCQADATEIVS